jgi:tetratricopeptide (TPR) repeat protein
LTDSIDNLDLRKETFKKAIHHYEKGLSILEPWRILHMIEENKRIYKMDEDRIHTIYGRISQIETGLIECYSRLGNSDESNDYLDKAIVHANEVNFEEIRIEDLLYVLILEKEKIFFCNRNITKLKLYMKKFITLLPNFIT